MLEQAPPIRPKLSLEERARLLWTQLKLLPGWIRTHKLQAAVGFMAGMAPVALGVVVWMLAPGPPPPPPPPPPLAIALSALDRGHNDAAANMALRLLQDGELTRPELYGPSFILGVIAVREADEQLLDRDKLRYRAVAARFLREARDRGLPDDRKAVGLFLLGESLYLIGHADASRETLAAAEQAGAGPASRLHWLLARAYAEGPTPDFLRSVEHQKKYLACDDLEPTAREEGQLELARLEFRLGNVVGCMQALDKFPSDSRWFSEVLLMRGRVLLEEAAALDRDTAPDKPPVAAAAEKLRRAIALFREAEQRHTSMAGTSPRAMLLTGRCQARLRDDKAAVATFAQTMSRYFDSPEGFIAGIELGEYQAKLGRNQEALMAFRESLERVRSPDRFSNPWITLDELRDRLLAVYESSLQRGEFELAVKLTELISPVFPPERGPQLSAHAQEAWGQQLLEQAESLPLTDARTRVDEGRDHLRDAAANYAALAEMQFGTRQYPEHVWQSAVNFAAGQDYRHATAMYREYLRWELKGRRPQALVGLGEALLAQGRADDALVPLDECLERHAADGAAFAARLLAALASSASGDAAQAERLLLENLGGDLLAPSSQEWRDSLFALARLLYGEGRYDDAIPRLEEAVARYPDAYATIEIRYLLGECYRLSVVEPDGPAAKGVPTVSRPLSTRRTEQSLQSALPLYNQVVERLEARQEKVGLTEAEASTLRNAFFCRASVLFWLGRYDESSQAYLACVNRYQDAPEVLDAYVQLAACYRRLNKPVEAKGTLLQAKVVLNQLRPEADFRQTTNYSREEWSLLLDSMMTL